MPTAPRSMTVEYGTQTFGADSTLQLHDKFSIEFTHRNFAFEFQVLVSETTDAAFRTLASTVESVIRRPFQDLEIIMNGQILYNFRESSRLALNTRGQIISAEDVLGTRLARLYTIRFEGDMPAAQTAAQPAGLEGWREAIIGFDFTSSRRRTITITGEWTATPTPSQGARTAYEASSTGIDAYASSVLTAIDSAATWRLEEENFDLDEGDLGSVSEGSVLRFSRTYREVLFRHAGIALAAGVESGAVARQILQISRDRTDLGSAPGTRRLLTATANYDAWIDSNVVSGSSGGTNVGDGLENLWDNTIREFILDRIRSSGILSGAIAVITETPSFEFDENRITAVIVVQGGPGVVIERRLTLEENETGGITAVPIWDGNLRSRFTFNSPVEHRRTIHEVATLRIDLNRNIPLSRMLGDEIVGGRIIERQSSTTPLTLGTPDGGGTINVVEASGRVVALVFQRSDGTRLSRTRTRAAPTGVVPFLFDFSSGVLEFTATARRGEGFGQAPIDFGGGGFGQAGLGDIAPGFGGGGQGFGQTPPGGILNL